MLSYRNWFHDRWRASSLSTSCGLPYCSWSRQFRCRTVELPTAYAHLWLIQTRENRRWRCCSWCPSTRHCQSCNSRLDYLLLLADVHRPRHIKTVPRHRSGGAVHVIKASEIEYLTVKTVHHSDIWHPLLGLGQNVFQLSKSGWRCLGEHPHHSRPQEKS